MQVSESLNSFSILRDMCSNCNKLVCICHADDSIHVNSYTNTCTGTTIYDNSIHVNNYTNTTIDDYSTHVNNYTNTTIEDDSIHVNNDSSVTSTHNAYNLGLSSKGQRIGHINIQGVQNKLTRLT